MILKQISGMLCLLNSYSKFTRPVLTVYGSEDGVLNRSNLEKGRSLLPKDSREMCIPGGNHAQFGSYGKQKGDGLAEISGEEQIGITAEEFLLQIQ